MSMQSPVGTLDIKNATLRVGKLEVSNIQGVDTALNVTRSNAILIYDDQVSTTTFTGFTSTAGVRDTGNGYLDLADGYVYWGQKLPNSWVMEFEMDIRSGTSAGPLYSNIFSTSNVGGDGYTFTFNDNNDKITLKYDGTTLTEATVSGLFTASENWQKVAINYERGRIAISIGASRKFFYQDIERSTPYVNGEYVNFSSASTDGRKIRNLKITNGTKWTYAGESNVAFQQGSVGIGVTDPAYTLDVGGDINLSGSFYQGGSPFVSSLWTDGANSLYYRSNVEVGTGNLFVDTTTSNVGIRTTTPAYELDVVGNVHADYFLGDGSLLTGLVTKLEDVVDNGNVSSNTIQLTNTDVGLKATGNVEAARFIGDGSHLTGLVTDLQSVVDNGNVSSNTIQLTNTDVGLKATGNVEAARFIGDGSHLTGLVTKLEDVVDNGNVSSNTIQLTNTDVGLKATGNVEAARFIGDGSHLTGLVTDLQSVSDNGNTTSNTIQFTNSTTGFVTSSNVGIANTNPQNDLDVGSNLSVLDTGSNVLSVTGNVSATSITIGDFQIVSAYGLDHVTNENNQTTDTIISTNATTGFNASSNIVAGGTVQANKIVSTSNLEVGTANLFVDTTTSNVGIGTNTPDYELDVVGNVNATYFIGDGSAISAIQSSNVSDFGSNVSRITTLESSRALKSDLNNNSARITNLSSNLSDNSSRITALESGDISISGEKTFTGQVIFESNIHMAGGNVLVANTVNMTVSDPIIELGSNNINTGDLGIIMTRHNDNSNVAFLYDESDDILRIGYTLNGASSSVIYLDSNALAVNVQGTMTADKIVASNVIPATSSTTGALTVAGGLGVEGNVYIGSNLVVTDDTTLSNLSVTGNVHVGTAGQIVVSNAAQSTSSSTGALQIAGGLGVAGNVHVGSNIHVTKGNSLNVEGNAVMKLHGPHDRPLVKYPEVAMTASSVGGYTVSEPTNTFHGNSSLRLWRAFNNDTGTPDWETVGGSYDTGTRDPQTSGSYAVTTVVSGTTYYGVYAQMLAPIGVKVSHVDIRPQNTYGLERLPGIAVFAGSDDGTEWTLIRSVTNNSGALNAYTRYSVNATQAYKYIRIIWNKLTTAGTTTSFRDRAAASEIKIFGTEEGDASVDVVHRSVPNKPGQQHLEVYWDANDSDSYSFADSSSVYDLSGSGVTGTITGNNGFDAEYNAWVFDGSGDYISTTSSGLGTGGAFDHSFAFWFKINRNITNNDYVVTFGEETNDNMIAVNISGNSLIHLDNWGRGVITGDIVRLGTWYHVACTHTGSATGDINTQLIYVNGIRQTTVSTGTGTLAFTSNKITIGARPGGGTPTAFLDGAVSNVRFFKGKALNADQVRELYEYDAPRFGHRQNLVSLHKGNLGVGVSAPTARLEIAGDERIQEYPPRAMTGYETYMEGHGVFCASASSFISSSYMPYYAFDKNLYNAWLNKNNSSDSIYLGTDHLYSGINGLGGYSGEWIGLKLPHSINLKTVAIHPRQVSGSYNEMPEDGVILGYDDKTGEYETLDSWVGVVLGQYEPHVRTIQTAKTYNQFFLLGTRTVSHSNNLRIGELKFLGTPAPSTLDDGHLTLGKQLTTPRVSGHAAGAETPRAESLIVHYDTTVDSVKSGSTAVDISGTGNNGTFNGDATYSSTDRALTFDGTGDFVKGTISSSLSGNHPYSFSMWVKPNTIQSGYIATFEMGNRANNQACGLYLNGGSIVHLAFANNLTTSTSVVPNQWIHITGTYTSGSRKVYADGVLLATDAYSSMNIGATEMTLGANNDDSQAFNGSISNFKLYDVALTADEVAAEYALGRTGKALNITDTAVCLGGTVPRAQLDVRGSMIIDGIIKHSAWPAFRVTTNNGENVFSNGSGGTNAKSSGHNNNTNSSDEVIPWKNVVYDNTGSYTYSGAGDYKFTAPVSGIYHFHFHCLFTRSSTNSVRLDLKFFVNGGLNAHLEMNDDFSSSTNANVGRGHTTNVHLNAGNFVQAVFTGVGGTWGVYSGGAQYFNVFSGQLIAAD